jgi:phage shock protein C
VTFPDVLRIMLPRFNRSRPHASAERATRETDTKLSSVRGFCHAPERAPESYFGQATGRSAPGGITINRHTPDGKPAMQQQPYRRLYRSRTHRVLGGVAGGIGAYFNIDPVLARIALTFGLIASTGPFAPLVYLLLYFIIPLEPEDTPVA